MLMSYFSYSEPVQIAGVLAFTVIVGVFLAACASISNSVRDYEQFLLRLKDNSAQRLHELDLETMRRTPRSRSPK